jgi:hypothetical protein
MTLVIFDGNTKNYTVLDKNDNADKIELIKVQDENNENKESIVTKQTKPKISGENKIELTNENQEFLNSLTKDPTVTKPKKSRKKKIELTKENQDFLNALKTGSGFKIIPKYLVQ